LALPPDFFVFIRAFVWQSAVADTAAASELYRRIANVNHGFVNATLVDAVGLTLRRDMTARRLQRNARNTTFVVSPPNAADAKNKAARDRTALKVG